ncbi:MAG: hypothetical protein FWD67_12215 [Betaproteobacteria bacterium]|nr:hypothetical protein [Betaproteobacteria bacterium]
MKAKTISSMVLVFLDLCLLSTGSIAAELPIEQCPSKLTVKQSILSPVNDGWKAVGSEVPIHISAISISLGEYTFDSLGNFSDVQNGNPQAPSEIKKLRNGDQIFYYDDFDIPTNISDGSDYWILCGYHNSRVILTHKIPENATRCEVKHLHDVTVPDRITIKCFDTPRKTK